VVNFFRSAFLFQGTNLFKERNMETYAIAATAISILVPYVAKGAEEFIKTAGKDGYEKTKALFATLKARWEGNDEANSTLANFEKNPERHGQPLKSILEDELAADPGFKAELSRQVTDIGPYLEVIQKMKTAEDVVGLQADEMNRGAVKVNQEIDEARNVKGAEIKRIG
jgi:hypothetical protein